MPTYVNGGIAHGVAVRLNGCSLFGGLGACASAAGTPVSNRAERFAS